MDPAAAEPTMTQAVAAFFLHPIVQEVLRRTIFVAGAAVGLKMAFRFLAYTFTPWSKASIKTRSRHMTVSLNMAISGWMTWVYRYDVLPAGRYLYEGGERVQAMTLKYLAAERLVYDAVMFGAGSLFIHVCGVIALVILEKKYRVKLRD